MHLDARPATPTLASMARRLDFLWLELTNRCNLRCAHCYTDSDPASGVRDRLGTGDYLRLMREARALGCRKLQFIGGEPQLHPDFQLLLEASKATGFAFVEVFSNLTRLADDTLAFAQAHAIRFATSVYSDRPEAHDAVTGVRSSHARTVGNLRRLVEAGVATRAAIIDVGQGPAEVTRTEAFLRGLGVGRVRSAPTQPFGRGATLIGREACLDGLCGHCWSGKLCVAPDGHAFACVMARDWPVGDVRTTPLAAIVRGDALDALRTRIHDEVWLPRRTPGACQPGGKEEEKPLPQEECPQSCGPEAECIPYVCPQSCDPSIVVCEPTEGPFDE